MTFFKRTITQNANFNEVIALLTMSDVFTWGAFAVVSVLAGLYIEGKLPGERAEQIIGIGMAIYYLSRSLFQIPIGMLTDRLKKDTDEILFLTVGSIMMGAPFLLYHAISDPLTFYILQFVFGVGVSMNVNSWRKLFARNLDKDKEGLEYAVYDTVISVGIALLSIGGGTIAALDQTSFDIVIFSAGIIMIAAGIWSILLFTVRDRKSRLVEPQTATSYLPNSSN